jgi:hypothetical protein
MTNDNNQFQDESDFGDLTDDIGDLLRTYARADVPDDFLAGALSRFDTASAAQFRKRAWMAFGVGLGSIIAVATPILWLVIFNFTSVSKAVAVCSRISLLIFNSIVDLWSQLPEVSFGILIALWITLFGCAVMLLKTFRHVAAEEHSIFEHNVPF